MNKSVLIVEDEFIVANDLRLVLEKAGYKVTGIAASVEEAEAELRANKPGIVLIDIRLKGKATGIDLAKKLKSGDIPFVYLSANSNQKILEEAKVTEPYGFLVKPFREKDLLLTLDIARYRHQHSLESKLRQEESLRRVLAETAIESISGEQKLLKLARAIQANLPFDLLTFGLRPLSNTSFNDIGYLRIGFDEYQFIGKKELMTITGIKEAAFASMTDEGLRSVLFDSFNLQSYLVVPVTLDNGQSVHYAFYSRQRDMYQNDQIDLLGRLKNGLTDLAGSMTGRQSLSAGQAREHHHAAAHPDFKGIIGNHHLLLSSLDLAAQVAPFNTSVLILGESGTGKEKVAQAIHSLSPRKNAAFVKLNCAAIPATLVESELFGHEKGAFTGATEKRKGKFEQANGGTIFLDEIGELPLDMQVKLLRVLQEKEIEPVGGSSPVKVDVRIVAATNRNLEKEVGEGRFRLDLYYRLNVFPITLPALRERRTDIQALATYFAEKYANQFNKPVAAIGSSMMEELVSYDWPGNIRELENIMEQAVVLNNGKSDLVLRQRFAARAGEPTPKVTVNTMADVKQVQRETEREYIISILRKTKGRIRGVDGAAELLNMKPTTLESKMAKLDIRRQDFTNS
ncbi:sigma 54-interacting transcriptional regulator [Flavihumibacter solisilvae]|uniref:Fis family transcriptional regulator n=1 Tax=Flavihumibacter solisilvae TaxID=1349421 RepID=A0A0C1L5R1_9BACT|nr:sigma 54-interacting transcriptional regulator [Flavihumibacter solisilvae]KIC95452.1 Fis family transcriptional regulator [Flavihumibacter solisilvae]